MELFKAAFRVKRENSDEIYKGFGFKQYSDVTQYYLHPNNQSVKGRTTLCQPIGEAINLFALLLKKSMNGVGDIQGELFSANDSKSFYLEVRPPDDWRINDVIDDQIASYKALLDGSIITLGAYDDRGHLLDGNMEHLRPLYKLLPVFSVLIGREMQTNDGMKKLIYEYVGSPAVDIYVNIHEDFYQNHKEEDYEIVYRDVEKPDLSTYTTFSHQFEVIKENRETLATDDVEVPIVPFAPAQFEDWQLELVPDLPKEFVLPSNLRSVCSSIAAGDVLSVLFHGPSGTGKTISCKLVCQNIGMPIMDTVNCTENLDEFVLGKFIPEDDRIVFKESFVTKAIRFGGAVVFEEINFAKPQYLAFLNSLLDDNGFVRLDTGEVVRRHPNFRFFATMNIGYFGTKELNQALFNRFNNIIEVSEISDDSIRKMLLARVPECEPVLSKLLGVYHKIKKKITIEELDIVISPRNLENWARAAKYEGYVKAAEKTIVPIAKTDAVMKDTIRGILILYKWS